MLKANVGLQTLNNKYLENDSSTKYRSQPKKNSDLQKFEDEVCKIVLEKSRQKKELNFRILW